MRYLHTMVRVKDVDASLDFYCNKLGLEEVRRMDSEAGRYTLIFLAAPADKDSGASDAPLVERLAGAQRATAFDPRLTLDEANVVWAVRNEMARTVEDVLSRRTRALLLDAQAAIDVAPRVAQAMAAELGRDAAWAAAQATEFRALAARYLPTISHAHAASLTLGRESMPPEKPT